MKSRTSMFHRPRLCALALVLAGSVTGFSQSLITSLVEANGDNEATDTITAKWTGQTWLTTQANEPALNTPVGTPYTVPVFGNLVPCYVDRAHAYAGATADLPVPDYLLGGEYIMSGNDNRDNATYTLTVTVSDSAIVYMLIDNRLSDGDGLNPPNSFEGVDPSGWTTAMAWMGTEGFTPVLNGLNRNGDATVPDEIGIDEGADGSINQWFSVYSKTVGPGTFTLYQADNAGRNMYGAAVKRLPNSVNNPPEIKDRTPRNDALFYTAAGGLAFTATTVAPNSLPTTNILLFLNGVNVSSALNVGGSATSRSASYTGLQPDRLYSARIVVSDQAGRAITNTFAFDTFLEATSIAVEAEDYNYEGGQFVSPATPGSYAGFTGTRGIDYQNNNNTALGGVYRTTDFVGQAVAADQTRKAFSDIGATDHQLTTVVGGDWWNYTRTQPEGSYRVYLRGNSTVTQRFSIDLVTAGSTTVNQTTRPLGTLTVGGQPGYGYGELSDAVGNGLVVRLPANPTLRLTAQDAAANIQLNYLLLVPTTEAMGLPYVATASPAAGALSVLPASALELYIANAATAVSNESVTLTFNGVDVTSGAIKAPTAEGLRVSYDPPGLLELGTNHTVQVVFTDTFGSAVTNEWAFRTVGSVTVIPASYATPVGSGGSRGLNFKIRKAPNLNASGAQLALANTALRANQQLADQLIDPDTQAPYVNEAAGPNNTGVGTTSVVNYNQTGPSAAYFAEDTVFPFVDLNWDPDPNNLAMEFTTYLELAAGSHRFGVRSDDGFQLAAGPTFAPGDATLILGQFEGGRGDALPGGETTFDFMTEVAGVYAIRLIWYEGTGGANVELYSIDPVTSKRTLINDPAAAGAVKAYTSRTTQVFVPEVTITSPTNGTQYATGPTNIVLTAAASVTGGQIAKVEFFDSATNKLGEATTAPYTFTWDNRSPGRHTVWARATDNKGITKDSDRVSFQVALLVQVNFQNTSVMEPPAGYLPDFGYAFVDDYYFAEFGYHYGWDVDNTANARDRNNAISPDERYDTFNHMQKPQPAGSVWEIEVPNGRYNVFAVAGESDNTDSVFDVTAEGVSIVKGTPTASIRWYEGMGAVAVTDGRLSLGNGPTAANNKIAFVEIYRLPDQAPTPVLNAPVRNGDTLTITWTGGRLQETAELGSQWTDVPGNPQGTHSVSVSAAPYKFYRVVAP